MAKFVLVALNPDAPMWPCQLIAPVVPLTPLEFGSTVSVAGLLGETVAGKVETEARPVGKALASDIVTEPANPGATAVTAAVMAVPMPVKSCTLPGMFKE